MSYKIVLDSSGELPCNLKNDPRFENVPLTLIVGNETIIDDETFQQKEYLQKVATCSECAKSACPSPERYMDSYETEAEDVYVITLSSKLSGSYNSACLGKSLYEENKGQKNIYVIDSESASVGQSQIALRIVEFYEQGKTFEEICPLIDQFRDEMRTYFVLDNLETLRKNGRLTKTKAVVAATLSIKPVMGAEKGEIIQLGQAMGIKKALQKLADMAVKNAGTTNNKRLMISHCNCPERAEVVKKYMTERGEYRDIIVVDMAGLSSTYANDGGIIVTL